MNDKLSDWKRAENAPRRAGVSSFGLGGTNTHIILEEAPESLTTSNSRQQQLFLLSAKSDKCLVNSAKNLGNYLKKHSDTDLPDVAYTLQIGRRCFRHRLAVVSKDRGNAVKSLLAQEEQFSNTSKDEGGNHDVVFMFTG